MSVRVFFFGVSLFVLLLCTLWEPCAHFSSIYCSLLIQKKIYIKKREFLLVAIRVKLGLVV